MSIIEKVGRTLHRMTTSSVRRDIAGLASLVTERETNFTNLPDNALRVRALELRQKVANGMPLDVALVDAFALVRETAKRVLGQRPYDVQVMGGIALHRGAIAEMKTGEGKTLAATMPAFLNALAGEGVHVVTINDYLAGRDAEWMGGIYRFLGLSIGVIKTTTTPTERREAYKADVTYGLHTEVVFDYLRDNMLMSLDDMVQRELKYAIVDEIDSVLIDEARMPLEVVQPSDEIPVECYAVDRIVRQLDPELVDRDEKRRTIQLLEAGFDRVEELLRQAGLIKEGGLYDLDNVRFVHLVGQALHAH